MKARYKPFKRLLVYVANLSVVQMVLWCYLMWYCYFASVYFSSSYNIWLNSLGLAGFVGFAMFLSTGPCSSDRLRDCFWQTVRLFVAPFLVSSFSALVKGKGFVFIFSPKMEENAAAFILCLSLILVWFTVRLFYSAKFGVKSG